MAVVGRVALRLALAAFLCSLAAIPVQAGAEDPTPDVYHTSFAQILGIIGGGSAEWIVSYPTDVPTTGTYHVAFTASTTAAASATLTLTGGTFQGAGCTIGTLVVDPSSTSQVTGYLPVTVTGEHCFGSVRMTLAVGANTVTAIRASFQIAADTVNVAQSGGLRVQVCGYTGDVEAGDCEKPVLRVENFTANVAIGNQSVTFPDTINATVAGAALFGDFDGLHLDGSILLLAWLAAFIWCLRRAKLFAAVAATVGVICVLLPGPEWIGWTGVLLFVLALWLEAVARDRLPYHWFKGTDSSKPSGS